MDARPAVIALFAVAFVLPVTGVRAAVPPDLTGTWRLDAKRSDVPQRRGGGGPPMGGGREGRMRPPGGMPPGGDPAVLEPGGPGAGAGRAGENGRGRRTAPLPEVIHITETPSLVSFEDTTGVVLQEVVTLNGAPDTLAHAPGAPVVPGEWRNGVLEVKREGRRGVMMQTFTLEDGGRTLVMRNRFAGGPEGATREFKRVYQRASE